MSGASEKKRLAVIGHPVGHSRSPQMQEAALREMGLAGEWSYEALDVAPETFERSVRGLPDAGFVGVNVTIPHKEAALELADEASAAAVQIGAANTLSFEYGRIHADNTDAGGLIDALRGVPVSPRGVRALVLGAGGAARAAVWALAREGAVVYVNGVDAWNRSPGRAESAYRDIERHVSIGGAPVEDPRQEDYGIVVNTTSVGLRGEDPFAELPLEQGKCRGQVIVDLVYGDQPSRLLSAAESAGATVVDGIEVLVQQGARSLKIWTERDPPIDVMRNAARKGLSR